MAKTARTLTLPPPQWGIDILAVVPSPAARRDQTDEASWEPLRIGSRRLKFHDRAEAEAYATTLHVRQRASIRVVPIAVDRPLYDQ